MKHNINKTLIKTILGIVILSFMLNNTNAQTFETRRNEFFAVNVLTSGMIGGIGSMIHKKEKQKLHKAFLSGFAKGCIGGTLTFTGKYMIYGITNQESYWMGWPAKLVHAAGSSIIENAARNAPLYDNWAIDYGAIRVDVNYKGKSTIRLQSTATLAFLGTLAHGNTFDIGRTIKIGTPYFKYYDTKNNTIDAYTLANCISLNTFRYQKVGSDNIYNASGHEDIHVFQFREALSISNLYLKNKNKWLYFDVPNFYVNYYVGSFIKPNAYYSNYYENEAESLSRRIKAY